MPCAAGCPNKWQVKLWHEACGRKEQEFSQELSDCESPLKHYVRDYCREKEFISRIIWLLHSMNEKYQCLGYSKGKTQKLKNPEYKPINAIVKEKSPTGKIIYINLNQQ